jgi:hypothetical protein
MLINPSVGSFSRRTSSGVRTQIRIR